MKALAHLAGWEVRDGLRNRWIAGAVLLLAALSLTLAFLGSAPIGQVKASAMTVTVVSLASLSVYLIPLIALMLSFDALVGEDERGTLLLLLTYPVARWQVVIGKFLGHVIILAIAIGVGYGVAGVAVAVTADGSVAGWTAYAAMMGSSLLLGAVFVGLGQLVSGLVRERSTAVAAAIALWILLVVLYDLGLLGLLLSDTHQAIPAQVLTALIVANPTDAYRIFNLAGSDGARLVSGMAGIEGVADLQPALLIALMLGWMVLALAATVAFFQRREL